MIFVRNELTVYFLFEPRFGNLVQETLCIGNCLGNRARAGLKVAIILTLIVYSMPLMLIAVAADLKNKNYVLLLCHLVLSIVLN